MGTFECWELKMLKWNIKYNLTVNESNLEILPVGDQFTDGEFIKSIENASIIAGKGFFDISSFKGLLKSSLYFFIFLGFVFYRDKDEILKSPERQKGLIMGFLVWFFLISLFYFGKNYLLKKGKNQAPEIIKKNSFTISKNELSSIVYKKIDGSYNILIGPTGGGSIKIIKNDGTTKKYYITGLDNSKLLENILSEFNYI